MLQSKLEQQTQASSQELLNIKKTLSDAESKNDRSALIPLLKRNAHCFLLLFVFTVASFLSLAAQSC